MSDWIPASGLIRPVFVKRATNGMSIFLSVPWEACRFQNAKSFGSWHGVILTAPVPNFGSTNSASGMIGSLTSGNKGWQAYL